MKTVGLLENEKYVVEDYMDAFSYIGGSIKSKEWKAKRKIILKRDNYQCQIKGAFVYPIQCERKQVLNIHHINHYTKDNRNENLITLCQPHHEQIHILEKQLSDVDAGCIGFADLKTCKTAIGRQLQYSLTMHTLSDTELNLIKDFIYMVTKRRYDDIFDPQGDLISRSY